jgi:hypothetical protein
VKTIRNLLIIASIIALISILAIRAVSQDAKPSKDPLKLTEAEIKQGQALDLEIQKASNAVTLALEETLSLSSKDQAEAIGWKISVLYRKAKEAQTNFNLWLEAARKAHDCAGCSLQSNSFVRPPAKQ